MAGEKEIMTRGFFTELADLVKKSHGVFALFDASDERSNGSGLIAEVSEEQVDIGSGIPESAELMHDSWTFLTLGYDLKNHIEKLNSNNHDPIGFPEVTIWKPGLVTRWDDVEVSNKPSYTSDAGSLFTPSVSKEEYLNTVELLLGHIQQGDVYEINYCIGFEMKGVAIDPVSTFSVLQQRTRAPFSSFVKLKDHYLICASPERFLRRTGSRVISQPIKGTVRRGNNNGEDAALIRKLRNDPKERAENIMITDLVRNDLSRVAENSSVNVDELCEVYSFKTVHQLISTISAEVGDHVRFEDLIRAAFPMGSMTGAPKVRAMELIERYETIKRGIYSGCVGYYTPAGDFDLNVVIRSIQYNRRTQTSLVMVGGAITAKSDPEKEYDECLLKADALLKSVVTR